MRKFLATMAIASALLVSGCSAPATITEDDPAWNCQTMGNGVCGESRESEAWESFTVDSIPADVVAKGFKAHYVGSYVKGQPLPTGLTLIPSTTTNYVHGFWIEETK